MDSKELQEKLQKKLKDRPAHLTPDVVRDSHHAYIDYHVNKKYDEIYVIPMEEMAELTQHLSKIIRNKEGIDDIGFLEELVDVQICIDNLRIFHNIDPETFEYIKDIKLERNLRRVGDGTA